MNDNNSNELKKAFGEGVFAELKKQQKVLFWSGLFMLIGGFLALVFPVASNFAVVFFVGWMMILAGAIGIFSAFSLTGTGPFFGAFLWGLLSMAAGVYMVTHPLIGAEILTIMVAVLFLFQGAQEIVLAMSVGKGGQWGWLLFSGVISIGLTMLILTGLPGASMVMLGVLFGINFMSSGIAFLMLANALKKDEG